MSRPEDAANQVHPTAVIGDGVVMGTGNQIGPYAVILGPATIGDGNWIGPHAAIGTPAQSRSHHHGPPGASGGGEGIEIGDRNVIREFVTIHQGTAGVTHIDDDGYFMAYAHIPHDAWFGEGVTVANSAQIGGHSWFGPFANIGLGVTVHQWTCVGAGAMVGMQAAVTRDVAPYALVVGAPAKVRGINAVGLARLGHEDPEVVAAVGRVIEGELDPSHLPPDLAAAFARFDQEQRLRRDHR